MRRAALLSISVPTCLALLATVLVAAVSSPAHAQTPGFRDIAGNAHHDAIVRLTATTPPIAGGYPDGTFRPSNTVTRGQMASFLARRLGLPTAPRETGFTDVPPGYTHAGAIASLVDEGITTGYADGTFRPDASISREHMAVFLERAFRDLLGPGGSAEAFTDVERYQTEIGAIVAARITEGATASTYRPNLPVRRDQMASFIARTLDLGAMPAGASCTPSTGVTSSTVGTALQGVILNHAVRHEGLVYAFSMDSAPTRIFVWDPEENRLERTISFPNGAGQRTWATEVVGSTLYIGQDMVSSNRPNLYSLDLSSTTATPQGVAYVEPDGDFWDLTSDDDGILYAATRVPETIFRVDPQAAENERVTPIRFRNVGYQGRHEVTSLVADQGVLLAGLRGREAGGSARLLEIDPSRVSGGIAQTRDLTSWGTGSANRLRGQGVYAMTIDRAEDPADDQLLLGLQSSDDAPASFARFEREPANGGDPTARRPFQRQPRVTDIPSEGAVTSFLRIEGENRYLVAGNSSGHVHRVGADGGVVSIQRPVPNAPIRQLIDGFSRPVGVSSTADLWTLDSTEVGATPAVTNLMDDLGVPRDAPIRPHSIGLVGDRLVTGGNNILQSRPATGGEPFWAAVSGEAKAMTTDGTHAYVATYPKGQLWRFDPSRDVEGAASLVYDWDDSENRPWGIAWDPRRRQVIVTTQSDYQDHGTVFAFDPARPEASRQVWESYAAAGDDVPSRHGRTVAVVGDRVLVGSNGANPTLSILDAATGDVQTRVSPANGLGNIQAIVGDGSRAHLLTANGWWVVVNAETGAVYRRHRVLEGTNTSGDLVLRDGMLHAASSTRLVTVDPRTAQVRQIASFPAVSSHLNQRNVVRTTGSGAQCGAYVMRGSELARYGYQPWPTASR